jgi:acyl carrier protein
VNTEKALKWLSDALSVQGRVLTLEDTRATVGEWDSLGDLLLLAKLEDELSIYVSPDEIAAISSIKEIASLMEKNNAFSAG